MLTAERARELLNYDPETGVFTWAITRNGHVSKGRMAGGLCHGYLAIKLDDVTYMAHRVAWLMMTGAWPSMDIDHIDLNRANNRWANLREATRAQNVWNRGVQRNNASGVKGVSYCKRSNRYRAQIHKDRKQIWLGYFQSRADAEAAVIDAVQKYHGEFGRVA